MSRVSNYRKRRQQLRMKSIISIATFMLSILCVFMTSGLSTNARSISDIQEYKYFMSYELEYGDSLWSIAEEHVDASYYSSVEAYIDEICIINAISEDTKLYAGMNLIIPYFSTEFK